MPTTDEARQQLAQQQQGTTTEVARRDPTQAVLDKINDAVERVLPKGIDPKRFNRILLTTLRRNPDLLKANTASLYGAIVTAAECGLEPGTHEGHCWIVGPFRNRGKLEAVFMLGYKGLVELALRSGRVASIIARPVYDGEPFTYRETLSATVLTHDPMLDGMPEVDKLRGAYAIARLSDHDAVPISVYLSRDQIESYRRRSKSPDGPGWTDDYVAMALKTAAKRLEPWLPKSPELRTAVLADEQVARWEGGDVQVERDEGEGEAIVVNTVRDEGPDDDVVDGEQVAEDVDALRKPQLVKRLRDAGLDHDGKVDELRERWRAHVQGSSGGDGQAEPHGEGGSVPAPPEDDDPPAADVPPVRASAAGDQGPPVGTEGVSGSGDTDRERAADEGGGAAEAGDTDTPGSPPPSETWKQQAGRLDVKVVPLLNELKGSWGSLSRRLNDVDRDNRRPPSRSSEIDDLARDYPELVAEVIDQLGGGA